MSAPQQRGSGALPLPVPPLPPRKLGGQRAGTNGSIPRPRTGPFSNLLDQVPPPPGPGLTGDISLKGSAFLHQINANTFANGNVGCASDTRPPNLLTNTSQQQLSCFEHLVTQTFDQQLSRDSSTNSQARLSPPSSATITDNGVTTSQAITLQSKASFSNAVYFTNNNQVPTHSIPSTPTHLYGSLVGITHSLSAPSFSSTSLEHSVQLGGLPGYNSAYQKINLSRALVSADNVRTQQLRKGNTSDLIDLGFPEPQFESSGDPFADLLHMFDPLHERPQVIQNEKKEEESTYEVIHPTAAKQISEPVSVPRKANSVSPDARKTPEIQRSMSSLPHTHTRRSPNRSPTEVDGKRWNRDLTVVKRKVRADKELVSFEQKLRALRAKFPASDYNTNTGLVISPILEALRDNSLSVKLVIDTKLSQSPITFTCNVNTSIEHIISHIVCTVVEDLSQINFDSFVLKVFGLSEYLAAETTLAEYSYVLQCHKFDKDVRLTLLNVDEVERVFARDELDDQKFLDLSTDDLLPMSIVDKYKSVNFGSLNILLDVLESELRKLLTSTYSESEHIRTQSVEQAVKAICNSLGRIETAQLKESLEDLSQHFAAFNELRQSDVKKSNEIAARVSEVLNNSIRKLHSALYDIIKLYSSEFPVDFEPNLPSRSTPTKSGSPSVPKQDDSLLCYVGSISQPCAEWKERYREYFVLGELWHGEQNLARLQTQPTKMTESLFPQRLAFDELLNFEALPLNRLPRETCLYLALIGVQYVNSESAVEETEVKSLIALTVLRLFDSEETLAQGSRILGMWTASEVLERNKFSLNCRCYEKNAPLLLVNLPELSNDVKFPTISWEDSNNNHSPQKDMHKLDPATQTEVYQSINRNPAERLIVDERKMLWDRRHYLYNVPNALPKVLQANDLWESRCLPSIYSMIDKWTPLPAIDAMQLLLSSFPDLYVRRKAVSWIQTLGSDELCDFLPQLVQALRFEPYLDSPLVWFFIEKALLSVRVAHHLYWLLKENISDPLLGYRCRILLNVIMQYTGRAMKDMLVNQEYLLEKLTLVSDAVKSSKESVRLKRMHASLETVHDLLEATSSGVCLPLGPSMIVHGINVSACSYFTSNTLPLKLVFKRNDVRGSDSSIEAIYKIGDDLRQDTLTMQMIRIMDKLWLKEGLDLKIVTFSCVSTEDRKGFVEMVKNSETLRKIQTEQGLTGSFNERSITEWLRKYNTMELEYQTAKENFTQSCAGYAVATFILGICDRHNDNIMLTTSGHLFHIDFGKFLGDAQMMGNIKRDRVPFVLTSDMAYVINGGSSSSKHFQEFIELCCQAYNIIRRHSNLFLSLFSLMTSSTIPGVTVDAVKYIHQTLCPELSEAEAMTQFTRKIEESLRSRATQFNFFVHNLAQMRFNGDHNDQRLLSFATKTYSRDTDGKIISLEVVDFVKRYEPEKQYFLVIKVVRNFQPDPSFVLRTFRDFCELHQKLSEMFPLAYFHPLSRGTGLIGRSNTREVAVRRKVEVNTFLKKLMMIAEEVSHSEIIYTFFHPLLIDQEQNGEVPPPATGSRASQRMARKESIPDGQVKLSIVYKNASLIIMVMHAKNLSAARGTTPDCYVKTYLTPDPYKTTKRKTKIAWKNQHPTFMEMVVYQMPLETVRQRVLQVSVWEHDRVSGNIYLGASLIPLGEMDLLQETVSWYPFTG